MNLSDFRQHIVLAEANEVDYKHVNPENSNKKNVISTSTYINAKLTKISRMNKTSSSANGMKRKSTNSSNIPDKRMRILKKTSKVVLSGGNITDKISETKPGMVRLIRFLNLIDLLSTKKESNEESIVCYHNVRAMIYINIHHIVGPEYYIQEKAALLKFLDPKDLGYSKMLWLAARQYGKTVATGKFIAAMFILSPMEGNLLGIWGPTHDRAKEMLIEMNGFVNWIIHSTNYPFKPIPNTHGQKKDNSVGRSCETCYGNTHVIKTVASTMRSSRGAKYYIIVVDEIGFCDGAWYYEFARALDSVQGRTVILVTTYPKANTWLMDYMEQLTNAYTMNKVSEWRVLNTYKHCQHCLDNRVHYCPHKMYILPPFNTATTQLDILKNTSPDQMGTYLTEVCGIPMSEDGLAFPFELLKHFSKDKRIKLPVFYDLQDEFYVSVDPPSHTISGFGMRAFMFNTDGIEITFGLSEVHLFSSDDNKLMMIVSQFMKRVRALPYIGNRPCIKIIEAQNNVFQAGRISKALDVLGNTYFPVVNGELPSFVWDGVGVSTTQTNKTQGIALIRDKMIEKSWRFAEDGIVVQTSAYEKMTGEVSWDDSIIKFIKQCSRIKPRQGKMSGAVKNTNLKDDMAMACIIGTVWAKYYRNKHYTTERRFNNRSRTVC
jgi:hypothetical protein